MIAAPADSSYMVASFTHLDASCSNIADIVTNVQERKIKVKKDTSNSPNKSHEIVYSMDTVNGKDMYHGRPIKSYSDSTRDGSSTSWYLAIKNNRTGKVSFRPTKFVIFNPNTTNHEDFDTTVIEKNETGEFRSKLTLQFGSRLKKRALESKLSNAVDKGSLSTMVSTAMSEVRMSTAAATELNSALEPGAAGVNPSSSLLPAFNADAATPSEIYDLNDIVPPLELAMLDKAAEALATMSVEQLQEQDTSELVINLTRVLPQQKQVRRSRCAYLAYIDCLLKLCVMSSRSRFAAERFTTRTPDAELARRILARFAERQGKSTGAGGYRVLATGKDKLLAHILILLLSISEFEVALSGITKATGVSDAKLLKIGHVLGCTIKKISHTGERILCLKAAPQRKPDEGVRTLSKRRRR